ncbi:hypothetical protein F4774DRAFT_198598 [Daldinia eschscholtzii]|nr:hypothetical protein F4774DRAFT_198598 [Daldinia eschscholtzii]
MTDESRLIFACYVILICGVTWPSRTRTGNAHVVFLIPLFSFRTCQCQHELTSTIFFFSVFFLQNFLQGSFKIIAIYWFTTCLLVTWGSIGKCSHDRCVWEVNTQY